MRNILNGAALFWAVMPGVWAENITIDTKLHGISVEIEDSYSTGTYSMAIGDGVTTRTALAVQGTGETVRAEYKDIPLAGGEFVLIIETNPGGATFRQGVEFHDLIDLQKGLKAAIMEEIDPDDQVQFMESMRRVIGRLLFNRTTTEIQARQTSIIEF